MMLLRFLEIILTVESAVLIGIVNGVLMDKYSRRKKRAD